MITVVGTALDRLLVTETSCLQRPSTSLVAADVAAVLSAVITSTADKEGHVAEPAANLSKAVLHESPGKRTGNLSWLLGICDIGRTSVCCRSPEGPGCDPGPSFFRCAACRRSLPGALVQAKFSAAHAGPPGPDERGRNLRIGLAVNTKPTGRPPQLRRGGL